jgi:hypothetical protein
VDLPVRGRGHAEGRRETTPDAKFSDTELAVEDARRQAKDARASPFGRSHSLARAEVTCRPAAKGPTLMNEELRMLAPMLGASTGDDLSTRAFKRAKHMGSNGGVFPAVCSGHDRGGGSKYFAVQTG